MQQLIPTLKPFQFDDYLFDNWKAPTGNWYDDFHIERIETYKNHLKLPMLPHRRSVFYFVYVTQGAIIRTKLLNQYEVMPQQFFFLAADTTTSIEFVAPETTGFYCHFKPEIFQVSRSKIDLLHDFPFFLPSAIPLVTITNEDQFVKLMHILETEYHRNDKVRFELISMYLLVLLTEIKLGSQGFKNGALNKNAAFFLTMRYQSALSELIYDKTTVSEFAEHLSVTPNHLNKSVKLVTGKLAHELLTEMKILEAKVLLKQSDLSIGEIAYKIGNMAQSDFSRFFKSKTQLTPKQYRIGTK